MTTESKPPPDETSDQGEPHRWEAEMEVYPTRAPEDDPKWAIRVVTVWITISIASLAFIIALIILGLFYD
jgi:hypothetical protein